MGELNFKDNVISYTENGHTQVLLNFKRFLDNKSRVSMHALTNDKPVMQDFIIRLMENHQEIAGSIDESGNEQEYLLLIILLISLLIPTSLPVKVAELGCTNGIMSYYLASVLGHFHPDSSLCCVSDVIGNSSGNQWLDKITLATEVPKLSMMASDYDDTQLAENHFDIVVINGTVLFHNPEAVIREAEQLAKKGGIIFCYACDSPLLEHYFQMHFPERNEYSLKANVRIMTAECSRECWKNQERDIWKEEAAACLKEGEAMLNSNPKIEEIRQMAKKMEDFTKQAMDRGELDWKIGLIDMKERLLDSIVWLTKGFEKQNDNGTI